MLHIHYMSPCYVSRGYKWILTSDEIRCCWQAACSNVVGGRPNVAASVDSTVIRSSAVGYISKYMSKGGESISFIADICPDQLPSQWWSTSRNLRKALRKATVYLSTVVSEYILYQHCTGEQKMFPLKYERRIYINVGNSEKLVGLVGQATDETIDKLRDASLISVSIKEL